MRKNLSGFTLVEITVVIVVISILATTTALAYNNVQQRAYSARVISVTDAYAKALQLYHVRHGAFPDYGPTWGTCLGRPSDYPAANGFPAGACTVYTNRNGVQSSDFASDSFYNDLSTVMSPMPDPTIKIATESYGVYGSTMYRGIYYEQQNNSPGTSYGDWGYVEYVLNGIVACPQAYVTRHEADGNVTFCSHIIQSDTGTS